MTPRFQSAVMTCEDWDAWHFLGCTSNDEGLGTIDFYELADRRDAGLMLRAGAARAMWDEKNLGWVPLIITVGDEEIPCGGELPWRVRK